MIAIAGGCVFRCQAEPSAIPQRSPGPKAGLDANRNVSPATEAWSDASAPGRAVHAARIRACALITGTNPGRCAVTSVRARALIKPTNPHVCADHRRRRSACADQSHRSTCVR